MIDLTRSSLVTGGSCAKTELAKYPLSPYTVTMSEFDAFMETAAPEGSATAGEPVLLIGSGQTVNAVFDENNMSVGIERYGDSEEIMASAVIARADLQAIPTQKTRVKRLSDGVVYYVQSVSTDGGHVELALYREGKRGNG